MLSAIFATGQRTQLLPIAAQLWPSASQLMSSEAAQASVLTRKLAMKLVQRIGLTFLPPKVASWRYQRGQASLHNTLHAPGMWSITSAATLFAHCDCLVSAGSAFAGNPRTWTRVHTGFLRGRPQRFELFSCKASYVANVGVHTLVVCQTSGCPAILYIIWRP